MASKSNKNAKEILSIASSAVDFLTSDKGLRIVCGTYSDGKTRSVVDALRDEYISPKDRERWEKKKAKKKKKKKKGKKKKEKSIFEVQNWE